MSEMNDLCRPVDVCCPHCDEFNELWDVAVSVCVWNTDVGRKTTEAVSECECEHCNKSFKITAHLDINVEEIP